MKYNPDQHHRRSIRLKDYDYTQPGAYFITICTWQRQTPPSVTNNIRLICRGGFRDKIDGKTNNIHTKPAQRHRKHSINGCDLVKY